MNAITTNFYDSASGRITDPVAFLAADADVKKHVIGLWAADNARHAASFADKVDAFMSDAQVGYAFLTPQLYRIETEVYMTKYPSFDISRFMSVDSSGDMWDVGTLVYSMDQVGQAEFLAAGAFDVPYASTKMAQSTHNFHLAGIGYEWNTQELQRAERTGAFACTGLPRGRMTVFLLKYVVSLVLTKWYSTGFSSTTGAAAFFLTSAPSSPSAPSAPSSPWPSAARACRGPA